MLKKKKKTIYIKVFKIINRLKSFALAQFPVDRSCCGVRFPTTFVSSFLLFSSLKGVLEIIRYSHIYRWIKGAEAWLARDPFMSVSVPLFIRSSESATDSIFFHRLHQLHFLLYAYCKSNKYPIILIWLYLF